MAAKVTTRGGAIDHRCERLDWLVEAVPSRTVELDVVSDEARSELLLFATEANVLYVEEPGPVWTVLPTDPDSGVDLGAFTAGQRKALNVRFQCDVAFRDDYPQLLLDGGI